MRSSKLILAARMEEFMEIESSDHDRRHTAVRVLPRKLLLTSALAFLLVFCAVAATRSSGPDVRGIHGTAHAISAAELASCGSAPELDGEGLDSLIQHTSGVLIVGIPEMRCTQAMVAALQSKGMDYTLKEFKGSFQYTPGVSDIWDWLHCSYPDDKTSGGMVMHSYVFAEGKFQGQGFAAAEKVQQGLLSAPSSGKSCEERFMDEADVLKQYQTASKNKVLLFGWLACPCTAIAQTRLASESVCYEGRTWANPNSQLMAYLQCKEGKPDDHSFVYFRTEQGSWDFVGNGFDFDNDAMPQERFASVVAASGAATTCKHANIKVNVFGTPLEECRTDPGDMAGSWQDDGTCSEQIGGIHEICIERLPADFSSETHQSAWSEERADQRHCVCVGAWSLYMTDAAKHPQNAKTIMPHCKAIPETALTARYLHNWKDWNGYPANIVQGVGKLVERCLDQAGSAKLKCGLRQRFEALSGEVPDLKGSSDLQGLEQRLQQLSCSPED
eukprot:TRINITY_DN75975_c0_g1_i1.p1 TRINITY_DN75975_c0_g1~~TRINITY_DN75975_c0_g1_i1.p1  ORF type:complete len:501 (-),score=111.69 TRINITY_DN75975_c0_g1_i1:3-1505(-)